MSVIGKKPFVNSIIDACSKEQVNQISRLMDNLGNPKDVALYGQDNLISDADKGVNYVSLAMEQISAKIIKGILVYIDTYHCGFFGIATNSSKIEEFKIDPINKTFLRIREDLTVEELRQVCGDAIMESGGEDGREVNIITFNNVALDSDSKATLIPTAEDWAKMSNVSEECIVVIKYSSGAISTLGRTTVATSRIIFASQHSTTETLQDVTATFIHIDGDGYYSGGVVVDTMLEANSVLDEQEEYADLHNIVVNGETYIAPKTELYRHMAIIRLEDNEPYDLDIVTDSPTSLVGISLRDLYVSDLYTGGHYPQFGHIYCLDEYRSPIAVTGGSTEAYMTWFDPTRAGGVISKRIYNREEDYNATFLFDNISEI